MLPTEVKEAQKVHPQPMDDHVEAIDALISRIFINISSLKSAYIQLQAAHTPYVPDDIQLADKQVIAELKNLSQLKHFYRENNPKPLCVSPQDSRLAAEIQQQLSLLKTYEIEEATLMRQKLEKNLKLSGLSTREQNGFFPVDLTPDLFVSSVEATYKAIHDFSKPLINMMKAAGWDLDAAAQSIEPSVVYAKRSHKKYAFESCICQRMFLGFQQESFTEKPEDLSINRESFCLQYLALREMDPLDALGQNPNSNFGKFCRSKYVILIHPKMEASFGNLDQRNFVMGGGHPRTPFYQAFLKLAKSIWLLHRLVHSFDPSVKVFQVNNGTEFSEVYMESVVKNFLPDENEQKPKAGLMVMPGFWIGGTVIQSRVYLTGMKVAD